MEEKSCIIVSGMHRSGTSLLTKLIHDMGFELPSAPLDAHLTDNAAGYWEPHDVVQLNNSLLRALNLDWKSIKPLHESDLFSDATAEIRLKIREYLQTVFTQKTHVVIKDPRMCRLLPVWQAELKRLEITPVIIMVSRSADQVCRSLEKRASVPEIASAAITNNAQAYLLWLRYTLEAERHSRNLPRYCLSYENLNDRPEENIQDITRFLKITSSLPLTPADSSSVEKRPHPQSRGPNTDIERLCSSLHLIVSNNPSDDELTEWLDTLYEQSMVSIPDTHQHECPDIPVDLLTDLYIKHITGSTPLFTNLPNANNRPVVFISDNPQTRSHIYRVKNPVDALNRKGIPACWNTSTAFSQNNELLKQARKVIIHRSEWSSDIQTCIDVCKKNGTPLAYDIDDLILDEEVVIQGHIDFINQLPEQDRLDWLEKIRRYRRTLDECGQLYCSTDDLALHASNLGYATKVIGNGFSRENLDLAKFCQQHDSQLKDGRKRVGYASGTATHAADFATITDPLMEWLNSNPDWTLTIIGQLDVSTLKEALPAQQLEIRPLVQPVNLACELTRLSINLIPLEMNPFCNAKSPLKWYEAALCGVPSIASNNPMYSRLFRDGMLGLAASQDEWYSQLQTLASDSERYRKIQHAAFDYCMENLNADKLSEGYL